MYQARRPGAQAARQSSTSERKVFPKRRPATSTRKRAFELNTFHCGGLRITVGLGAVIVLASLLGSDDECRWHDRTDVGRRALSESKSCLCPKDRRGGDVPRDGHLIKGAGDYVVRVGAASVEFFPKVLPQGFGATYADLHADVFLRYAHGSHRSD